MGHQTGFYLHGTGGIGKSFTVLGHLDKIGASYKMYNSRMTAKGLFLALSKTPDAVIVLEDMERLTKDRDAQGVLRSALWAQPGHDRIVTWTTATGGEERAAFRGGLILLANRPLADLPELRALATRIVVLRLDVTEAEVEARMRDLAASGYHRGAKRVIDPERCGTIVDYLTGECRSVGCALDLRLLDGAYQDYLQWDADNTACGWQDLVASRVREAANHFRDEVNTTDKEERQRAMRKVVREIIAETSVPKDQVELYKLRAGSRADFFRRKREVESGEFDGEE